MPGYLAWVSTVCSILGGISLLVRIIPPVYRWFKKRVNEKIPILPEKAVSNLLIALCIVFFLVSIILQCLPEPGRYPMIIHANELDSHFFVQKLEPSPETDKAVLYGTMIGNFEVPLDSTLFIVKIIIPNNGWGEGLSGPDGSSLKVIAGNEIREILIDSSMDYHHGRYYKYGAGEDITNIFELDQQNNITLEISMIGGSCLDIKQIILDLE